MDDTENEQRFKDIIGSADSRDQKMWAIHALLEEAMDLPADARLDSDRVLLSHIDYGGHPEQGLSAQITHGERSTTVPLSRVRPLKRAAGSELVAAYRRWERGERTAPGGPPPARNEGAVTLAVLGVSGRTARCLRTDTGAEVVFRPSTQQNPVAGSLIVLNVTHDGSHLAGTITEAQIDATVLRLTPATVVEIAGGEPAIFELREVTTDSDAMESALEDASGLARFGDVEGARRMLNDGLNEALFVIEAHRQLGAIALDRGEAALALTHFAVGAAIGDLAVPEALPGLFPWDQPGNRPWLACLFGCARALFQLGRRRDAEAPLLRLLEADPDDHQGGVALLRALRG